MRPWPLSPTLSCKPGKSSYTCSRDDLVGSFRRTYHQQSSELSIITFVPWLWSLSNDNKNLREGCHLCISVYFLKVSYFSGKKLRTISGILTRVQIKQAYFFKNLNANKLYRSYVKNFVWRGFYYSQLYISMGSASANSTNHGPGTTFIIPGWLKPWMQNWWIWWVNYGT